MATPTYFRSVDRKRCRVVTCEIDVYLSLASIWLFGALSLHLYLVIKKSIKNP